MKTLRIASLQFEHRANDKPHNLSKVEAFAHRAAWSGAACVVMPEMCITGYWHVPRASGAELMAMAEPVDGPSLVRVAALSSQLGIGIGVGWLERDDHGTLYNAYRLCLPDGSGHTHRKLHAFEHPLISSGDCFTVFDTPFGVRMAILICWDNNLVENARACALLGADLLLAPHQTGGTASLSPHGMKLIPLDLWHRRDFDPEALRQAFVGPNGRGWLMRWLPSRAHDNGMFIAFSNGVGLDEDEVRTGNALILDPYGRIVAESTSIGDDIVVADLDLNLLVASSGRRWMHGRRPELYDIISTRRGKTWSARKTRFGED